jgi:hypothetical protein
MESSRLLKILAIVSGALVLWTVLYLYQRVPRSEKPFANAADVAEEIAVERGGSAVHLKKTASGWKVAGEANRNYPIEEDRIKTLLSGLRDVRLEDEISSRADRAADFDVTPASGTAVRLLDPKGTTLAEGLFGKQAPDFTHIYFRFPNRSNVYLARGMIRGELGGTAVNDWRSRQLITIPEAKIQGVLIEGKGFKTDLVRASTDTWTMNGKRIDPAPVNSLIGTLAHLRADDFVDPGAYPDLTFEGLTFAKLTVKSPEATAEIRLGSQDPKTKRYPVSISKDAGLAWLPDYTVDSLLLKPSAFKEKK